MCLACRLRPKGEKFLQDCQEGVSGPSALQKLESSKIMKSKKKRKMGFDASPITTQQRKLAHIGSVFIVPDSVFNKDSPSDKPRRAVLVSKAGGNIYLAPIRRVSGDRFPLSNFDGEREINLGKTKMVKRESVFSKKSFPGNQRRLSDKEREETAEDDYGEKTL